MLSVSSLTDILSCPQVLSSRVSKVVCMPPALSVPHPSGYLKFNVYGVVNGSFEVAGIGGVSRNHVGKSLITFSKTSGALDSVTVELLVIPEACRLFNSSTWSHSFKVIIECDCSNMMCWLNHPQ
ncbi:hypothetical protein V6N11_056149 [Hibiscus sabdariffa]|uniref:RNase H type-1 domain-containing protein n=1 Tax=Hibiscus sabdariffa TaxID=183260 RepID=A0ABR2T2Y8_9ROSI